MTRPRVLFLCTHNSARSQMAEGFLRTMAGGERFEVASAGTEATRVHPLAIRAMQEIGIDLTGHTSKTVDALVDQPWDCVIIDKPTALSSPSIATVVSTETPQSPFDKLRVNGMGIENIDVFPFVLSLSKERTVLRTGRSKHKKRFAGQA